MCNIHRIIYSYYNLHAMNASMTATLKYATTSYKKMQIIAQMIRGKKAIDALDMLHFLPHKSGTVLEKLVKSAVANATNNAGKKPENLVIKTIEVGRWPKLKRVRFVARARVHGYVKHRSFVKVELAEKVA